MRTGKFELVIVWASGDTQVFAYETEQAASKSASDFLLAFGEQIEWYGIRPERG